MEKEIHLSFHINKFDLETLGSTAQPYLKLTEQTTTDLPTILYFDTKIVKNVFYSTDVVALLMCFKYRTS